MEGTTRGLHTGFRTHFNVLDLCTCQIRILIVIDDKDKGGFGDADGFHLGNVLKILNDDPWSQVQFVVTKAHRQNTGEAEVLPDFRFDAHELSQYDQIWLFGIVQTDPDPLSPQELKALSQFMDAGGGVFAAGDHQNLGFAMCAEVPRVRSMRRWHFNIFGLPGEQAPNVSGLDRLDTLAATGGPALPDQSDAVPQRIRPRFYTRTVGSGIVRRVVKYPHPVLCGPAGVIEYLPDHMHEGLCEVPGDLTGSFTFDGHMVTEYPTVSGHQEAPEVIACSDSHDTTATEFGALAAYDGHRVNVGRVLVDASWHHWFNTNLIGFLAATDPLNPAYDPSVVPKWEAIKAYYRNVGIWLARPQTQLRLRHGALLLATRSYDVQIAHQDLSRVKDPLLYYWQLGVYARDALGRFASQCQAVLWMADLMQWSEIPLDPWMPSHLRAQSDPLPWIDTEQLELVALGGAVDALLISCGKEAEEAKRFEAMLDQPERDFEPVIQRGAAQAASGLLRRAQEGVEGLRGFSERAEARSK